MIGLLWYNRTRKPLQDAIREASKRFSEKFGVWPSLVLCNEAQLVEAMIKSEHVKKDSMVSWDYLQVWGDTGEFKVCHVCGRLNKADAEKCNKCGARLK